MQMTFKRSLIASLVMGLSLSAWAAKVPEGTVLAEKQEIIINNGSEPQSLDPHKSEGIPEAMVSLQLFEGLVSQDEDGNSVPGVAERWESSPDYKTWTFYLRKDAKWSNGDPVTAQDFLYSLRRLGDPKTASPYASYLEYLQVENASDVIAGKKTPDTLGIKTLDDYTLQFTLSQPVPYLSQMLIHQSVLPVPQKVVEKFGDAWIKDENIVGNGAYKLTNHVINEKLEFERNPHYWNDKEVVLNKATYFAIPLGNVDVQRYRAGDLDVTNYGLPAELFSKLKAEFPNELFVPRTLATYIYEFNNAKAPLNDVRVREALNLSLDRNIITDKVMAQGQSPTHTFTPAYINEGELVKQPAYSQQSMAERNEKAIKLLEEAGYSKTNPLKLTLLYNTNENHKKVAIAAASMWKNNTKGLVDIKLENQEWKTYIDTRRQGNYDIARAGWSADYNHASTFVNYFLSTSSNNTAKYANKAYDEAVASSYQATDAKGRAEAYAKAEEILAQDFAILPIYNYVNVRLVKPYVGGYQGKDPMDHLLLKNLYIKK